MFMTNRSLLALLAINKEQAINNVLKATASMVNITLVGNNEQIERGQKETQN